MPIKTIKMTQLPSRKHHSEVQAKALEELRALQEELKRTPLGPYELKEIKLEPIGKSKMYMVNTFLHEAKKWLKDAGKERDHVDFTRGTTTKRPTVYMARRQDVELTKKGRVRAIQPIAA